MAEATLAARKEVLERIWIAQAKALADLLEGSTAKDIPAATLNVARQFLADNGITKDSLDVPELAAVFRTMEGQDLPFPVSDHEDPTMADPRSKVQSTAPFDSGEPIDFPDFK